MQSAYDCHIGIDVVPLEPAYFDFMQHGINHLAAKTARDGIATIGCRYKPLPGSHRTSLIGLQLP